jgi:hypothetical protein
MQTEISNASTGNPITAISEHLQNSQGMTTRDLLIFAGIGAAIGLVVLGLTLIGRALGWWNRHSSAVLFRELCNAHQLGRAERTLLYALVRGQKLDDPTLIFVLPERLDEQALPEKLRSRSTEIGKLRAQIFGSAA